MLRPSPNTGHYGCPMMMMMIINNEGSDSQLTSFAVLEQFRFSSLGSFGMDCAIWEADVIVHVIVVASEQTCNTH